MTNSSQSTITAATLFPIKGLENTEFTYRICKVINEIPQDNFKAIRMEKWSKKLWRKLKCPVVPTERFGFPAFLIPANDTIEVGRIESIKDVPDKDYHIELTDQTYTVNIEKCDSSERDLICKMIDRAFTDKLLNLRHKYWKEQWTLFFRNAPENQEKDDIINAYRGFKFRVVYIERRGFHLSVDVRTKYISRKSFNEFSDEEKEEYLKYHLNLTLDFKDRGTFFIDYGKYGRRSGRFAGTSDLTIEKHLYDGKESIWKYYARNFSELNIDKSDKAVYIQSSEETQSYPIPSTRVFPVFTIDFIGVRRCSVQSQITPAERMKEISLFLDDIKYVKYGSMKLELLSNPLTDSRYLYLPPTLEFGNDYNLDPLSNEFMRKHETSVDSKIAKFGSRKTIALYEKGYYFNNNLPPVILLYPEKLKREDREKFIENLNEEFQLQTGSTLKFIQQIKYNVGQFEIMGSSLLSKSKNIKSNYPHCCVIAILWNSLNKTIHGRFKECLGNIPSQCIWERNAVKLAQSSDTSFRDKSRLRNLIIGISTEIGSKPWVISDNLHSDLHIGIDLLYGKAGYHYFYDVGGRLMITEFGKSLVKGKYKEAIPSSEIKHQFVSTIKSIAQHGIKFKSIMVHRDGRWWPSESKGLKKAIEQLISDNVLSHDVGYSVMEIHKSHYPLRLFNYTESDCSYKNPLPGTYLKIDKENLVLTTTGRPGAWDNVNFGRSAGTILFKLVESKTSYGIEEMAHDAYKLTHLNWSAPEIEISVPVTIKWTDDSLRESYYNLNSEDDFDDNNE